MIRYTEHGGSGIEFRIERQNITDNVISYKPLRPSGRNGVLGPEENWLNFNGASSTRSSTKTGAPACQARSCKFSWAIVKN